MPASLTFLVALLSSVFFQCHYSLAQIAAIGVANSELIGKSSSDQSALLATAVELAWKGSKCSTPKVRREKVYNDGAGGWLIRCAEGRDHWALVPNASGKATIVLACIHARLAGTDCYANFNTVLPEHAAECTQHTLLDRKIAACTAIIQSGRVADQSKALAVVYQERAVAFARYNAFDFAMIDFERSVSLDPNNSDTEYNRAVALERRALIFDRRSDFEQAIGSLNKVVELNPKHSFAYYERGYIYLKKLDYDRAIEDFDSSIRLNAGYAKAYQQRAIAFKAKGDLSRATADEVKAKELEADVSSKK